MLDGERPTLVIFLNWSKPTVTRLLRLVLRTGAYSTGRLFRPVQLPRFLGRSSRSATGSEEKSSGFARLKIC